MAPNSNLFHLLVTNRHVIPHWKISPTGESIESSVESYSQIGRKINSPCTCGPLAPLSGCAATRARSSTLGCVAFRWPPGQPPAPTRASAPVPLTRCGRGLVCRLRLRVRTNTEVCHCGRGWNQRTNSGWASVSLQRSNVNEEGLTMLLRGGRPSFLSFIKVYFKF